MSAVARRYAKAAVESLAERDGGAGVDALAGDLTRFRDAYDASPELREVLHNPEFKDERPKLLDATLEKLGVTGAAARLVRLLSQNDRINLLDDVARETETLADARAGRLRAEVESAIPLDDAQVKRVAKALEKRLGHPVVVAVEVKPELLGGLVCRVGDLTLDSSLKRQLEILHERLGAHAF